MTPACPASPAGGRQAGINPKIQMSNWLIGHLGFIWILSFDIYHFVECHWLSENEDYGTFLGSLG